MGFKSIRKSKVQPLEPSCKKPMYNSLEDAQAMIAYITESRITRNIKAYRCTICGYWHLTSKPK